MYMSFPERHVVLVHPEIHWNTGNAGRSCLGFGASLHLIKPLGFSIDSKHVKRAGLDYWHKVKLHVWNSFSDFTREMGPEDHEMFLFSKQGDKAVRDMQKSDRMFLLFGSERFGLPEEITERYKNSLHRIPMTRDIRSLNLSTSVGIGLYESLRG